MQRPLLAVPKIEVPQRAEMIMCFAHKIHLITIQWPTTNGKQWRAKPRSSSPRAEGTPTSEEVAQRKHVHVQTGVQRGQTSVGHVLKAIADTPVPGKLPVQSKVAGELKVRAEIRRPEFMTTEERRADAPFECQRQPRPAQDQARPDRPRGGAGAARPPPTNPK